MAGSMTKSALNLARLSLQVAQASLPAKKRFHNCLSTITRQATLTKA